MIKWSASRLDAANYCLMRLWLKYHDYSRPKEENLPAYAKGGLLHNLIEHFWERLGENQQQVESNRKAFQNIKYFDPPTFARYAQGQWQRRVIGAENSDNPIVWSFPQERWTIKNQLQRICETLFESLYEEGPPLFSEKKFDFKLDDKLFTGFIDEIRVKDGKVVIRDFKSGKPWLGKMKVDHDPQLTIYNAAICFLAKDDSEFTNLLGLTQKVPNYKNGMNIDPEFQMEFFMIEAPSLERLIKTEPQKYSHLFPPKILPTQRTEGHLYEVLDMINGATARVIEQIENPEKQIIYPERGRKCDLCTMKKACAERVTKRCTEPVKGINLTKSLSQEKKDQEKIKKPRKGQSPPNQLSLRLTYANSPYVSGKIS